MGKGAAMNEQENTRLVMQAYEKFGKGDIAGVLELCTEDIEWKLDDTDNMPFSGMRRGKEEVAQFFRLLAESQIALQFEPREYVAQGDKVVALGHSVWSVKSTHRQFETDWAEVFTLRDGKIARFREFADTAAAAAAYWPST